MTEEAEGVAMAMELIANVVQAQEFVVLSIECPGCGDKFGVVSALPDGGEEWTRGEEFHGRP